MKTKTLLLILAAVIFFSAPVFAEQEAAKEEKPCMIKNMIKSLFYTASPEDQDQSGFVTAPQK